MALQAVDQFMKRHNRPYSTNDVAGALKDFGKSAVQKSLDELVGKGKLRTKEYGKQKVYCPVQPENESGDDDDIDSKLADAQAEFDRIKPELLKAEAKLKKLNSSKTTEEITKENAALHEEIQSLKLKLLSFEKSDAPTFSESEKTKINKKWETSVKEYRKRKRIVNDILDQILEGYPKTKKHLVNEIGIEDDEAAQMPKLS